MKSCFDSPIEIELDSLDFLGIKERRKRKRKRKRKGLQYCVLDTNLKAHLDSANIQRVAHFEHPFTVNMPVTDNP